MDAPQPARPGRNEPCPCGSGRKYKQCCLPKDEALDAAARKVRAEIEAATEMPAADAAEGAEGAEGAESADGPAVSAPRTPKHQTQQPWRNATSRCFVPRSTTPRKSGGS